MTPTKIVANSMFGDTHVQNICDGLPCRSASGIGSAPPGSTAVALVPYWWYSSSRLGLVVMGVTVGCGGPDEVTGGSQCPSRMFPSCELARNARSSWRFGLTSGAG